MLNNDEQSTNPSFIKTVLGTVGGMYILAFIFFGLCYAAGWMWGWFQPRFNRVCYNIALHLDEAFPSKREESI